MAVTSGKDYWAGPVPTETAKRECHRMKTNLVLVIFLITVAACGYFGGKACQNRTGICEVVMAGGPR